MPIVLFFTLFVNLVILIFAYGRMRTDPNLFSKSLFGMLACTAGWNFCDLLTILLVDERLSIIAHETKFVFVLSLPGILHYFAHYLRFGVEEKRWQFFVRSCVTFPLLGLIATNQFHHLFRLEIFVEKGIMQMISTVNGPVYYFLLIYVYAVVLHSTYYILRYHLQKPRLYRGRTGMMLLGLTVSILANLAFQIFKQYDFFVDFTPVSFGLIAWLFYYAIFFYESKQVPNMAKTYILEALGTGVLFVDDEGRIVYVNEQFEDICQIKRADLNHKDLDVLPHRVYEAIKEALTYGKPVQYKMTRDKVYVYEIATNQLTDYKSRIVGTVISFKDVSGVEMLFVKQKYQYLNNANN